MKSISAKVRCFIVLFGLLLVIQFGLLINHLLQASQQLNQISNTLLPTTYHAYQLKIATIQVQQWLTDISATRARDGLNDGFDLAANYHKNFIELNAELVKLQPERAAEIKSWLPVFEAYYQSGVTMAKSYIAEGPEGGNTYMTPFDETATVINDKVDTFLEQVKENLRSQVDSEAQTATRDLEMTLFFAALYASLLSLLVIGSKIWIQRPLAALAEAVRKLAKTQKDSGTSEVDLSSIDTSPATELGAIGQGFAELMNTLKARFDEAMIEATNNHRIKLALDSANVNAMICDSEHRIIFLNQAMTQTFQQATPDFTPYIPGFDANKLLGQSATQFGKIPGWPQTLTSAVRKLIPVGNKTFDVHFAPVVNTEKAPIGCIVQWHDKTSELLITRQLESLIESANHGELSKRIHSSEMSGFYETLAVGVNGLIETVEGVVSEFGAVFSAMAKGDLTLKIRGNYQGEFDRLKSDANTTINQLTQVMKTISAAVHEVLRASDEIAAGNADLSQRSEHQASTLEETAASIEEMSATLKNNADSATTVASEAAQARNLAEAGDQVVVDAVRAMEAILDSSKRIHDIISVIDEIAFQTNLLALNAAVEAARAGEHGRGFAVVASEVRSLSQRSANAAKEIKNLIKESMGKIDTGATLVNESGHTLQKIVESIVQVDTRIADMTNSIREQSTSMGQINAATSQMDEITQQNAALVEQTTAASQALREQASELRNRVSFFRV